MTEKPIIRAAVTGGFDSAHIGHLRHLQAAKALGDYLIGLVSNDDDMIRKKGCCLGGRSKTGQITMLQDK